MELIILFFVVVLVVRVFLRMIDTGAVGIARLVSSNDPRLRARVEENILRRDVARRYGAHALPNSMPVTSSALKVQSSAPRFFSTVLITMAGMIGVLYFTNPPNYTEVDFVLGLIVFAPIVWLVRRLIWRFAWRREVKAMLESNRH